MGDFTSIISKSLKDMASSPLLILAGFIVGILSVPLLAGYWAFSDEIKAIAVNFVQILLPLLIMPFITGGALGYAVEVRKTGSSSFKTFLDSAQKNYTKMLVGGIIAFLAFYILSIGAGAMLLIGAATGDTLMATLMSLVGFALTFLCLLAIEFYDISIMAEGSGIGQAFSRSIDFVRRNLSFAVPFFIIVLIAKALVQIPISFGIAVSMMSNQTYYNALASGNMSLNSTLMNPPSVTMGVPSLITIAAIQIVMQGLIFAFMTLYKTEFYLGIRQHKKITDFDYKFEEEKQDKS